MLDRPGPLAQGLLPSAQDDLAELVRQACAGLPVPVMAALSDGQRSVRNGLALALSVAEEAQ
jgi:hypothetical protein